MNFIFFYVCITANGTFTLFATGGNTAAVVVLLQELAADGAGFVMIHLIGAPVRGCMGVFLFAVAGNQITKGNLDMEMVDRLKGGSNAVDRADGRTSKLITFLGGQILGHLILCVGFKWIAYGDIHTAILVCPGNTV